MREDRAFRPGSFDRLESREVLSAISLHVHRPLATHLHLKGGPQPGSVAAGPTYNQDPARTAPGSMAGGGAHAGPGAGA
jgi:hypothetical protein